MCSTQPTIHGDGEYHWSIERPNPQPTGNTSEHRARYASKGDALAKRIYDFTGKMLGEACANFAAFSALLGIGGLNPSSSAMFRN